VNELEALLEQILGREAEHAGEDTGGPGWAALEETGLTRVGIDEALGGCGGDRRDAVTVTVKAGEAGLGVPLTETLLLAGQVAAVAGVAVPPGVVTVAVAAAAGVPAAGASPVTASAAAVSTAGPDPGGSAAPGGFRVEAALTGVPWGAASGELWLLAPSGADRAVLVRLRRGEWTATPGRNPAGEPRDDVTVDTVVERERVHPLPARTPEDVRLLGALGRSCQTLGALRSCLRLSREYALLRRQFGKPLTAHQTVRHELAAMACEVAAAEAAVAHAVGLLPEPGAHLGTEAALAVAAAKVQTGRSATLVARAAHQLHGAVGLTAEHPLHHFTTRLWSWPEECGTAGHWAGRIAELVRTEYGSDLWAAVTAQSRPAPNSPTPNSLTSNSLTSNSPTPNGAA
jgi:acyl-CoA dehydrogenase